MKVVLIEFVDELQAFLAYVQEREMNLDDFTIVAFDPKVQVHLKKLGVRYKNTLPYFNNDSHKNIIVGAEKIMNLIRNNFNFIDSNGLSNVYREEFALYIRTYLNHLYKMIDIIANIYDENSDCEVYAYVQVGIFSNSLFITDDERYLGLLAMAFAISRNIRLININTKSSEHARKNRRKAKGKGCKQLERLFARSLIWAIRDKKVIIIPPQGYFFRSLCHEIGRKSWGIAFLSLDLTRGLLPLVAYNLLSYLKSFIFKKSYQHFIINTNFIYSAPKYLSEISSLIKIIDYIVDSEMEALFTYRGINCLDFVREKVNSSLKGFMIQLLRNSHNIRYLFRKIENKMVMSYSAGDIMAIAGELGRITDTRCLFISHGTHPVPIDSYHEMELYNLCKRFMLSDYSHIAISTPVQERHLQYFKQKHIEIGNCEIKTGPLIFSSVTGQYKAVYKNNINIPEDIFVITHAVSIKVRHSERYYFLETLDEYFSSLADVVTEVNRINKCRLIIRIHPGFYLNDEEIKSLLPESNNYILHREGSFSEVLGATDLLVSYSSTTIDEALINRIPVLLYDKWCRYNHFNTTVYNESQIGDIFPVCYVNDRANLGSAFNYMMRKVETTKREDINVKKYSYDNNLADNFFAFINDSLGLAKTKVL